MTDKTVPFAGTADARLRAAFAAVAQTAGTGAACPPPDVVWESAAGRCGRRRLEAVVLHMGECGACAAAWRLARELQRAEGSGRVLTGPPRWFRRTWVQVAAAAAALVVAAGLALQLRSVHREGAAEFRGQEGDWIASLVPEAEALPRGRCVLRWTPGPKGTVFDIRVATEDLTPVARSIGESRAEFLVPPDALSRVPSGARIVWQVTAHLPDGSKADSRSFTTAIR
ncbi:MAG TPA: hypothetical protein VMT19_05360 [Thermoanaerobaculaceae bacterium]|nr:hypothetical protein [Thermoanaerobaculaceae bacterium]